MRVFLCLIGFLGFVSVASAQVGNETFTISVFGGNDIAPPTTPVLLEATPAAPTQIDLRWSTSTDNFLVGGYVLTRGTTTIATTTQTSFSDTGLSASTSYSYSVVAFDTSFNYSSSSNVLATTTPDFPPPPSNPPTADSAAEGTAARVVTEDLRIESGVSTTSFNLRTARPVKLSLRWGRTASYEIGYVVKETFTSEQAIVLTKLEPGTTYEFELIAELPTGREQVVERGRFTTDETMNDQIPSNVGRFRAVPDGSDVRLSWTLPEAVDIGAVRILRSHLGFPVHPQDGAIVSQGLRTNTVDGDILNEYSPVYYTAFVYDQAGNVSSGAVAIAFRAGPTGPDTVDQPPVATPPGERIPIDPAEPTEATSTIDAERVTSEMRLPELSEVFLEQGNELYSFLDQRARLIADRPYRLVIPVEAVSGNLKTIVGTVYDPTDNRQADSYLLRLNADGSAYVANVSPTGIPGQSTILVEIYDYEAATVARYQRPITFVVVERGEPVVFPDALYALPLGYILGTGVALTTLIIFYLLARSRRTPAA